MLKMLYALFLVLPRIVLMPWREFEVMIPERGLPFVVEGEYKKADTFEKPFLIEIKSISLKKSTEERPLYSESQREVDDGKKK